MVFAVDIDGVLIDLKGFIYEEGKKFLKKEIVNPDGSDVESIFDVSIAERQRFWKVKYWDYIRHSKCRENAKETIDKLASLGIETIVVTARKFKEGRGFENEEELKKATEENLKENGIKFKKLYFEPRPKVDAISKYSIDYFIDDDPVNIIALSKYTKVLIMDNPYNKHLDRPNTVRVHNWNEVLDVFEKLKKK